MVTIFQWESIQMQSRRRCSVNKVSTNFNKILKKTPAMMSFFHTCPFFRFLLLCFIAVNGAILDKGF